jgi:hypothetical protein
MEGQGGKGPLAAVIVTAGMTSEVAGMPWLLRIGSNMPTIVH